jgi:transcriptional regulator with XRE-family HTH domain
LEGIVFWMSQDIYAGFARRLVQLCDEKGLPERGRQAELARVCGCKPSSANKWFNAISLPDAANLLTIADWGRSTVDWLLSGRDRPAGDPTFSLVWVDVDEEQVLTQYRQCTDSSKLLVRDTLAHAEKDRTKLRAIGTG